MKLAHLLAGQAQSECHGTALERLRTSGRVDRRLQDLLGCLGRDLLDFHAAFSRCHHHDAATGAVHNGAEIELAVDARRLLDEYLAHRRALGTGLHRHQPLAHPPLGEGADLVEAADEFDAASLAAGRLRAPGPCTPTCRRPTPRPPATAASAVSTAIPRETGRR